MFVIARAGADLFGIATIDKTAFDIARDRHRRRVQHYLLHAYVEKVTAREGRQAIHSILQAATFSYVLTYPHHPRRRHLRSLQVQLPLGKLTLDHFQTLLQLFPATTFRTRDNTGALPLHIACRVGASIEILRLFVQAYAAALQTTDNNGDRPLHAACQADSPSLDLDAPSLESIRFVVEQDPTAVQAANNDGALPVHLLCGSRPSVQAVQYLVGLFQGSLEVRTHQGDLPLMLACKASSSESVLQVLLTAYPDALIYMDSFYKLLGL